MQSERVPPAESTQRLSVGTKLITVYFVFAYIGPMIANALFGDRIQTIYTITPLSFYSVSQLIGTYVLFLLLKRSEVSLAPSRRLFTLTAVSKRVLALYRGGRFAFALIYIGLGITFLSQGLNSYRYSEVGISAGGSGLVLVVAILTVIAVADLFHKIFVIAAPPVTARQHAENIALGVGLVIAANGTASMLIALTTLAFSVFPKLALRVLYTKKSNSPFRKVTPILTSIAGALALFAMAWFAGESIKGSSSGALNVLTASVDVSDRISDDEFVNGYFYYLISSVSSYYYAFSYTAAAPRQALRTPDGSSPLVLPFRTLIFRLDYITGGIFGVERPEPGSISRLNYVILTEGDLSDRAGTSPGLLAAFNYVLDFPLTMLAAALYLRWLARRVYSAVADTPAQRLSPLGFLLLLLFTHDFFQSPFDAFAIIDNGALYLALLVSVTSAPATQALVSQTVQPVLMRRPLWSVSDGRPAASR